MVFKCFHCACGKHGYSEYSDMPITVLLRPNVLLYSSPWTISAIAKLGDGLIFVSLAFYRFITCFVCACVRTKERFSPTSIDVIPSVCHIRDHLRYLHSKSQLFYTISSP